MNHDEFQWLACILALNIGMLGFFFAILARRRTIALQKQITQLRARITDQDISIAKQEAARLGTQIEKRQAAIVELNATRAT